MTDQINRIPAWFWVVSILALLWNIMGIGSFYMHVFISEDALATLPEAERALYSEYPPWTDVIFAIATITGLLGSIGLLMKKSWSRPVFIISLLAILVQMGHSLFMTRSVEVYGNATYFMPLLVIIIAAYLVWFSSYSSKKAWLH